LKNSLLSSMKKMKIDQDSVPSTVEAAVDHIVEELSDIDRHFILDNSDNPHMTHHGFGRYIRNNWSLWEPDSPLKRDAVEKYKIAHADDISGLIFEWVWHKVMARDFDPKAHCEQYHKHWKKTGHTSLEAGGWPPKE